jgi:formate dehydrogenase maturation protein FdhE
MKARYQYRFYPIDQQRLSLAKPVWSRELPSEPISMMAIKDCANRYFLSFVVEKGSNRRNKTRLKIAKLNNKIADSRKDLLHKLSTKVVSENPVITLVEYLNVSEMVKNRRLATAISWQGWRKFRLLCPIKSKKFSRTFNTISRWEATSQICSCCDYKWGKLDLRVRTITCLNCGATHDLELTVNCVALSGASP